MKRKGVVARRGPEEAWNEGCGLTNRNRIRGCHNWTSGLPTTKSIAIKGHNGISGGRAAKAVELTPGDLRGCLANGAERAARLVDRHAEVSSGHNRRDTR